MTFYNLKQSPEELASWISRIFYWWLNPIFRLGFQRDLEIEDLHNVPPEVRARHLGDRLEHEWSKEVFGAQKDSDPRTPRSKTQQKLILLKILLRVFGGRFLLFGFIKLFEECFSKMIQPLCLALLIQFFNGECDRQTGLAAGVAIIICAALNLMSMHPYYHGVEKIGMQVRIGCSSLLYRKAFRLSHTSLGKTTVGQMVNLLTTDASRFDNIQDMHFVWVGVIQVSISTYILWGYFGPYCLCGISVLLLFVPLQGLMGNILSNLRLQTAIQTDGRLRIINELISAMRVIKMYAWEKPFSHLVNEARRSEMKVLRKTSTFRAINWSISFSTTQVTIFLTLLVYVLDENTLDSEKVFVCVAIYSCIRITLGVHFPIGIYQLGEFWVSIRRIQDFLLLEERATGQHNSSLNIARNLKSIKSPGLYVTDLTAKWDQENTLMGVTMSVKSGQLCAVVGAVGAGKSSLLMAILKELPPAKGDVQVCGTIAYAPQESWVFAGSIRENILFGKDYNGTWYDRVIEACALRHDLLLFPFGDSTIVGDRGITLSGGQKARVSLARAVYTNADVYLLDDPLSAVDAEVANHIFQKCITGILKSKITVLVTHQVQFLNQANEVMCIDKGKVVAQGTSDELLRQGFDFTAVIGMNECNTERCSEKDSVLLENHEIIAKDHRSSDIEVESVTSDREDRLSGVVDFRVYRDYFRAGATICSFTALVAFNIATQLAQSGSEYWLQLWTESIESRPDQNLTIIDENSYFAKDGLIAQVWIYTGIIALLFVFSLFRTSLFFRICLNAGQNLHNRMFYSVLRASMQFFETNSSGRIINRFSKDTDLMDDALPQTIFMSTEVLLRAFGSVILSVIVIPFILVPTVFLAFLLLFVRRIYVRTALSIKRLEANARSPLLSHLSSSLYGITTIRAFQMEKKMIEQFYAHQDIHSTVFYLNIVTTRWVGMWLDWISVVFITLVIVILIFASEVRGSEAGLAVSSAMILTGAFQWGIQQSAAVETQMTSIERILRYIGLTTEAELESNTGCKSGGTWPEKGAIRFKSVSLEYGPNAKVLKDISFEIRSEEKVGIIGRTGAGKSSLLSALFRLTEPTGEIEIDGVDILKIGLHNLRSKISIIPQDPVLFQGSLRKNLDPFGNYPDEELVKSINDVNLGDHVHTSANGLDMEIHEGGSNLSVGQRQLVCLARAILRKNRILVLDEATANVDLETDSLVQRKVREVFKHCTVLTIAHRISTVLDCDRIIVMDQGRLQEFDTPHQLLQNPESALSVMVAQTSGSSLALN